MDEGVFEYQDLSNLSLEKEKKLLIQIKKKEIEIEKLFPNFFNYYKKENDFSFEIIPCPIIKKKIKRLLIKRKEYISPIIASNIKLIMRFCGEDYKKNKKMYIAKRAEISDIFQNCVMTILRNAFYRYDSSKKTKFMSYAKNWILYSLRREKKVLPHVKALPMNFWERWFVIDKLKKENEKITDKEIKEKTNFSNKTLYLYNNIINVDNFNKEEQVIIERKKILDFEEENDKKIINQEINNYIETLPQRTKIIIIKRLGLFDVKPETYEKIGRSVNLTKERVRQICENIIEDMRIKLEHLKLFIK